MSHNNPQPDPLDVDAIRRRELFASVHELSHGLLEGDAADATQQQLERLVLSSDDACWAYIQYMHESAALRRIASTRAASQVVALHDARPRVPATRGWLSALAALVLVSLLGFLILRDGGDRTALTTAAAVGSFSRSANVQWSAGAHRWSVGDTLAEGQSINFDSGRVELQFDSGALMTVVGPAALEIKSGNLVALHSGTATTRIEDGNSGKFRVVTSATEVLDLGTEFGVRARPDGQTDVVVFEGKVDVTPVATAGGKLQPTQTLSVGEAVCVNEAGGWRRVVAVESDAFPFGDEMFRLSHSRRPVIVGVSDDLRSPDSAKFYRIYHGGFGEDVRAYVDRVHEWNGLTEEGIPEFLRGADYVATFNDDSKTTLHGVPSKITVEVSGPAMLYVFYHDQFEIPHWLSESFENTGAVLGLDEGPSPRGKSLLGVGPGSSIDGVCTVWRRRVDAACAVDLGTVGRLSANPQRGRAMYGIAAQPF